MKIQEIKIKKKEGEIWEPETIQGEEVLSGKYSSYKEYFEKYGFVKELGIIDYFFPDLKKYTISRKIVKKVTDSGRKQKHQVCVVVGDEKNYVGIGLGKHKEVYMATNKAINEAKKNLIYVPKIKEGSLEENTIYFKCEGSCGSVKISLIPSLAGTGLVIGDIGKFILKLGGVKDIRSNSIGKKRSKINFAKAIINSLKNLNLLTYKIKENNNL